MRKPDFFIVGAPKSGTTALFTYLKGHPDVFLAARKEAHFFAKDLPEDRVPIKTLEDYLMMFRKAGERHLAVGEASTNYLISKVAINNILEFNPQAKLVAMVRNPIDMARSFHRQMLLSFDEDVEDSATAWRLQESRAGGENIPKGCSYPQVLQYGDYASVGAQVKRMFESVPREQAMVIVFDDFVVDTGRVYGEVLDFLGLEHDGRTDFDKVNIAKAYKHKRLARFLMRPPVFLRGIIAWAKNKFPGAGRRMLSALSEPVENTPLPEDFRRELSDFFRKDVELLSNILGRDLRYWLE